MAQIGCLGDIAFEASDKTVRTLKDMKWGGSANYAVHKRHAGNALTEFTGLNPDSIGSHAYGRFRWSILSIGSAIEHTDVNGDLYAVEVAVKLQEYLRY